MERMHENIIKIEAEGLEVDKAEYDFFVDPENPAMCHPKKFLIIKDGLSEDRINWLMSYHNIEAIMLWKKLSERTKYSRYSA